MMEHYTLMIVDDSTIVRNRIQRCFDDSYINIIALAENGMEALEKYKKYKPDIVTMDITMPKMDGLHCIQRIRAFDPQANILVISALADYGTALDALEYGACGFICKPFSDDELVKALETVIQAKHLSSH